MPDSRAHQQTTITIALKVLDEAAYRARTQAVATPAVRLALRVLLPHVTDREGLLEFWAACQEPAPLAYGQARLPYYKVCKALRDRGWDAPV